MLNQKSWIVFLFVIICFSCNRNSDTKSRNTKFNSSQKFAYNFQIDRDSLSGHLAIRILNPWKKGEILQRVVIGSDSVTEDIHNVYLNKRPKKIVVTASPHIGMLGSLNQQRNIVGATSIENIFDKVLRIKAENNELVNVGNSVDLNIEKILELKPDLVFITAYNSHSSDYNILIDAGIPVVFTVGWMEKTILGRSEWLKFYGALTSSEKLSASLFSTIEKKYLVLKDQVAKVEKKPDILVGNDFKGTWYMPGGGSYMAALLYDAGGMYQYSGNFRQGSLALGFESVIEKFINADYWIAANAKSKKELLQKDERYGVFNAFKKGDIYHHDRRVMENGFSDFWESGVVNAHIILADLVHIFHPEILPEHRMYYFRKLD